MPGLAALIGAHQEKIRQRWREVAVAAASAHGVSRLELEGHLQAILTDLAELLESEPPGGSLAALHQAHQATELRHGFDLEEAISEYLALGKALAEVLTGLPEAERPSSADISRIHLAVGATCATTVGVFFERVAAGLVAERRLLHALDDLARDDGGVAATPRWLLPALDAVLDSVEATAGALFLFDEDSGRLALAAARGLADVKAFGEPELVALVTRSDEARVLSATDPEAAVARALRQSRMTAGLGARLFSRGRPMGVLYVTSPRPRRFGFFETRRFLRFAGRVAVAVDLARLDETRLALVDRLEGEVRLRQEAVSHLGHDLRGHLAAIRLTAQALEGRPEDAVRVKTLAARIAGSVDAADRQLEDVLLANRVGAGEQLRLHPSTTDLGALVREVLATRTAPHRGGIAVTITGDPVGDLDADLFRRAVRHLVDNACRHGDRNRSIEVTVLGTGTRLTLSVHNQGPALAPDDLAALVSPLSRSAPRGATGLGLTLVHGCALAHGGLLTATSDTDGTTFSLTVPRHLPAPAGRRS